VGAAVKDKRIVLIDDSIVRGTTLTRIVSLLREAGTKEIHVRVSAPPFLHPCYYGTDIDSEEHLIANRHTPAEISDMLGADSLGYLPAEKLCEMAKGFGFCDACFTGRYPTAVPADTRKDRFEQKLSEKLQFVGEFDS
jgi:amidophosphoribosyltransferase